jgi:Fe-S cluster assembly protein SufD
MSGTASIADRFTALYEARKSALPGARQPWLAALRDRGFAGFAARGLPTPKLEAWKYTNLSPLAKLALAPAEPLANGLTKGALPSLLPDAAETHRLVFVNGYLRPDLCEIGALPRGVTLSGLAAALQNGAGALEGRLGALGALEAQPLLALNTALMEDGFVLRLGREVRLARPVELVFVALPGAEPVAYHPRGLVVAESGSEAALIERHLARGEGAYFANHATEIALGEGAALRHYKIVQEGAQAFHLATSQVRLERAARYESFVLALGGKLARNEIQATLGGAGAACRLDGAFIATGRQHVDNTTMIDHASPETTSREVYKGVLDGYARGVFQGRILVRPGAQKTDGRQTSRTLLLSEGAEIDAKPQLEIYADDVKCAHGATAGELEEEALFYLRSRGIPESEARHMLVQGFLEDVIGGISDESVRAACTHLAAEWLARKTAG